MSTRNRLTRSNNIAPELGELGRRVGPRRYEEGQRVRYKAVGGRFVSSLSIHILNLSRLACAVAGAPSNVPESVGIIRAVLRDPRQPLDDSPRYEVPIPSCFNWRVNSCLWQIENDKTHNKTAIYERNIIGALDV
jgi:hypothetical protein